MTTEERTAAEAKATQAMRDAVSSSFVARLALSRAGLLKRTIAARLVAVETELEAIMKEVGV